MQPKWSCKQALSLTGRKGTEKIPMLETRRRRWMEGGRERRGEGGGKKQEVGFYLTHRLSSSLYNILRKGFLSKVHALWFVHTQMLPLLTQTEKRHNEASVLSTPGRHTHTHKSTTIQARFKNVLVASQGIRNNTPPLTILYVTFF